MSKNNNSKPSQKSSRPKKTSQPRSAGVAVAYRNKMHGSEPRITYSKGGVRIKHREYITEISSGGTAKAYDFSALKINPGSAATFPWGWGVAANYETYKIHRMRFMFEPSCPTSTGGYVALAIEYDASDPYPGSKSSLLSMHSSRRSAPWDKFTCPFDVSSNTASGPWRFIRTDAESIANEDIKTYDSGFIVFAWGGVPVDLSLGELWVEYDIEYRTPGLPKALTTYARQAGAVTTTCTKASPGTGVAIQNGNLIECLTGAANELQVWVRQPGKYVLSLDCDGTGTASPTATAHVDGNSITLWDQLSNATNTSRRVEYLLDVVSTANAFTAQAERFILDFAAFTTLTAYNLRMLPYISADPKYAQQEAQFKAARSRRRRAEYAAEFPEELSGHTPGVH